MSFKKYLTETNDVMNLLELINKMNGDIVSSYNTLYEVKEVDKDGKAGRLLGNINLGNQLDKIENKMNELAKLIVDLKNSVTGSGTVSHMSGEWGGPD